MTDGHGVSVSHRFTARTAIVAEAAQGFEGDARLARLLVRAAHAGGADLVKFQLVFADELATREYQYYELFKALEMTDSAWRVVADDAAAAGLGLAFDVFGERSLDLALTLGACAVKLHATDFYNRRLVQAVFQRAPRVFLSLGGIEYSDVAALLDSADVDRSKVTLMYGFQGEPTAAAQNHLARLTALRARFPGVDVGFMDHADGDADESAWLGILAVALGARMIEKHVTLDRVLKLEDWVSALDPSAFARYVSRIRVAEDALGNAELVLTDLEREYGRRAIKAVVAARDLAAGAVLREDDIAALRAPLPSSGTVLHQAELAVGRALRCAKAAGQPICAEDIQ